MFKVVGHADFDHEFNHYVFNLENGDQILIKERDYDRIMIHESIQGNKYKAIVDEHEDEFEEPVEYLGFEIVK